MASSIILAYPAQLPQDFYNKNLPQPSAPIPPAPVEPPSAVILPPATVSNGGIYYGPTPPANPKYGWLWTSSNGLLYAYIEPGFWSQIGTNW